MALTLKLKGVNAISGGVLDLNGSNSGMASISLAQGWQPRVAKRRRGVLGGKVYEDVVEAIPLRVHGASRLECVTALETLAAAMFQASEWRRGASVGTVTLAHAIDGTTLSNPLETPVLGTPDGAADILSLPITFNRDLGAWEVNPVTLPVLRLGAWYGDEETASAGASTDPLLAATFSSEVLLPSPVSVTIDGSALSQRIVAFSDRSGGLDIASTYVSGGTTTANANAYNNNVYRVTPSTTAEQNIVFDFDNGDFGGGANIKTELYWGLIVLINNSSTIKYQIKAQQVITLSGTFYGPESEVALVPPASGVPSLVSLGLVQAIYPSARIQLNITPDGTGGAGDALDIDYIVVGHTSKSQFVSVTGGSGSLRIRQQELDSTPENTELKPYVYYQPSLGPSFRLDYSGVLTFWADGDETYFMEIGHDGAVVTDPSSSKSLTVYRRPAYLVPR